MTPDEYHRRRERLYAASSKAWLRYYRGTITGDRYRRIEERIDARLDRLVDRNSPDMIRTPVRKLGNVAAQFDTPHKLGVTLDRLTEELQGEQR